MKILKISIAISCLILWAVSVMAQSTGTTKEQAQKTQQHSKGAATGTKTPETRRAEASKGFDTRPTAPPPVRVEKSTATVESKVKEAKRQQAAQDLATAKAHPATGKPVPSPTKPAPAPKPTKPTKPTKPAPPPK